VNIKNKYNIGDFVYLVSDSDQKKCQIVRIIITPIGLLYEVSSDFDTSECYEIELSETKDVI